MAAAAGGDRREIKEIVYDATAGAVAGAIAATFVCPLDVIKTRFQVHGLPQMHPSGRRGSVILVSLQNIARNEGLKGLFRGLTPTLAALLPNWAVYFTVYGHLKEVLHSYVDGNGQLTITSNMIAAAGSGTATAIATNPLWVVKTRLQTQGRRPGVVPYESISSALRQIAREGGLQGCDDLGPREVAIASSSSKVVPSILTYPHEVIRSKLQDQGQVKNSELQYTGVIDCIKKVYKKNGLPGFYRGCATNLLRTTPAAVITFTSYEMIHKFLLYISPPEEKHFRPFT